jgi:hypothetical protein
MGLASPPAVDADVSRRQEMTMRLIHRPVLGPRRQRARTALAVALGLLVMALLARDTRAQEPSASFGLAGQVVGEGGRALVGAFVGFADSEWGSLTNEHGRFLIPDVVPGPAVLRVEQLGYETLEWKGFVREGEPLRLRLEPKPILLEGLTVVTDRFDTRRRGTATSVRWFDRADLATTPQETAFDFIKARAGLAPVRCNGVLTDRCLRVRGRVTEPVVWVDETPVIGGVEYLESLRPHELYMVEVYGSGRHIRAYTNRFMERAARVRLRPIALLF